MAKKFADQAARQRRHHRHIDHGKTTLTAAIAHRAVAAKFGGEAKAYDQIDAAPEEKAMRHHHQHRPRRVRNRQPPLTPTWTAPGPRRLRQEHDHRRRPDGRRHPGRAPLLTAPCPRPASTSCWPARWVFLHHRLPEQVRHGRRRRTARTRSKWKFANPVQVRLPRRRHPIIRGSAKARPGKATR